jgi:cholesterol oxidase
MGRHVAEGVCDENGEVFGFPGLHVLDGALLPGPVGANPSLTIAAVADRACDRILAEPPRSAHRPADQVITLPEQSAGTEPRTVGPAVGSTSVSFTEEMKGFVALDETDPVTGAALGRQLGQRLMFHLTITADDVERFVVDPRHLGSATGWVESDVLGGRLPVQRGWFNLFTREGGPDSRRMLYRLHFADAAGNPLTLVGHKDVHDDPGADVWRDTSTLYVTLHAGHLPPAAPDAPEHAPVVAAGVITIHLPDFLRQLTTFRTEGTRPAYAMEEFGRLFLGQLWEVYGPALAGSSR